MDKKFWFLAVVSNDGRRTHTVSFFHEKDDAIFHIKEHGESLSENGYYPYAVIEDIAPNSAGMNRTESWFSLRKDRLSEAIAKPEEFVQIVHFTIG